MDIIRYFLCGVAGCGATTSFNITEVRKGNNKITCSKCGKEWIATITSGCCNINIKFVSLEPGSRRPIVFIKSYPKA